MDHKFDKPEKTGLSYRTSYKSDLKPTKRIHEADLQAVRRRFLEVFVRSRPLIPQHALPSSGNFNRDHLIIGLFIQVVRTLFKYVKTDFKSEYLFLYPISSCCKNLYKMNKSLQASLKALLINLMDRYEFNDGQKATCLADIKNIVCDNPDIKLEDILDN